MDDFDNAESQRAGAAPDCHATPDTRRVEAWLPESTHDEAAPPADETRPAATSEPAAAESAGESPGSPSDVSFEVAPASVGDLGSARPSDALASDPLRDVKNQLTQILDETQKYNARAAQRENIIDQMHADLERLRLGERRALLRPLVAEVCRLRDDLLRQAETLPEPFDSAKAADLLRSYADSLECALEDNGVSAYVPALGDAFEARLHRASGRTPTTDPSVAGKIAQVVSPGYRDLEAESVIATARVLVYVLADSEPASESTGSLGGVGDSGVPPGIESRAAGGVASDSSGSASSAGDRGH